MPPPLPDPNERPAALPGGGEWVRRSETLRPHDRPPASDPLLAGLAWADAGVAPGGKATLLYTESAHELGPLGSRGVSGTSLTGRLVDHDRTARPDGYQARSLGGFPSRDEAAAWGTRSAPIGHLGRVRGVVFDLRDRADAARVRPLLDVVQARRRDRYAGPPLEVWPAPTFVDGPRWDAADPGAFRPSRRFNAVAVDEGAELTVVARLRPDDDVRHAELRVRTWAVAGGMGGVMDALPRAGWVPRVWQDVFVCVEGEGPDPLGDVRFRWRAERHGPTEQAVAHLRAAAPSAAGPLAARPAVYLGWVRVNGVVRSLPPLDVVGPEPPPRSTLS